MTQKEFKTFWSIMGETRGQVAKGATLNQLYDGEKALKDPLYKLVFDALRAGREIHNLELENMK